MSDKHTIDSNSSSSASDGEGLNKLHYAEETAGERARCNV